MTAPSPASSSHALRCAVDSVADVLPAQGPITVFVHHNTLHAFEDRRFERAVVEGGELLGCEPFLSEDAYREALSRGRIRLGALHAVIDRELGEARVEPIGDHLTVADVVCALLVHGVPPLQGRLLNWILEERRARVQFRPDAPADARRRILADDGEAPREEIALDALWRRCRDVVAHMPAPDSPPPPPRHRLRDVILARYEIDVDESVHPLLIRLSAAFLDQGVAYWPMPERERGFHAAFVSLYRGTTLPPPVAWSSALVALLDDDHREHRSELESLRHSLDVLDVPERRWGDFLTHSALALRGWAGMMRQIEERPDRVPVHAPPATLAGFLAVRLLIERAVLTTIARAELGTDDVRQLWHAASPPTASPPSEAERAWPLFQVAQLVGLSARGLGELPTEDRARLVELCRRISGVESRRLLHRAYEETFYEGALGALVGRAAAPLPRVEAQAIFCIDEREESLRRHLEELRPGIETFGFAGFFAVPMYFRGIDDAHGRPLSPVTIRPEHEVVEVPKDPLSAPTALRRAAHQQLSRGARGLSRGSTTLVRGTLITALVGMLTAIPLVFRVLFPRATDAFRRRGRAWLRPRPATELLLDRSSVPPTLGRHSGFTTTEMAEIVARVLEDVGVSNRLAPLVLIVGHGSSSLNNPQESAHDCGACGGGHGGPNARAFARMANDQRVRQALRERGLDIPDRTWFVSAEHNTCHDGIELHDLDRVPPEAHNALSALEPVLRKARASDAHERARRFASAPSSMSTDAALRHVEARSMDLAQPRPEYGHASSAMCIVGPRSRTRGLFLDRRAFLVSYDPEADIDGTILARVMSAATPVLAGISLEYYFGVVDPSGYGCGTKLPHNVSCLLGVMDGQQSDLRPGLPWQMVEIHEPMRLLVVVEAPMEWVERALERDPSLGRMVAHQWIRLFVLESSSGDALSEWTDDGFRASTIHSADLARAASSVAWYAGHQGHLPIAEIDSSSAGRS